MSTADKSSPRRRLPTFGPEPWPHPAPSGEWSPWDVWFAVACVVDCGGDWDDFDARLTRERSDGVVRGVYLEPLWSHLLDPRERLAADGLGAAELAGGAAHNPKVVARQPLEALAFYALQQGDAATARTVLRAADRPGFHRDRVRRRTIELDREPGGEGHV